MSSGNNDKAPFLAYPDACGSADMPAWVEFGIYQRKGVKAGNLETTVGLYMPDSVSMPSTVSWENESIGLSSKVRLNAIQGRIGDAIASHQGIGNLAASMIDSNFAGFNPSSATTMLLEKVSNIDIVNSAKAGAAIGGQKILTQGFGSLVGKAGITNNDGGNLSSNQAMGLLTGHTFNPYLTAIFRGVDFRTFEFSFKFYPHNEAQSQTIHNIIKTFRSAYLPAYTPAGTIKDGILDYPKEFSITYKWGTQDHQFVHKFKRSVMTGFETNYTGTGQWASMKNSMPASIQVSMRFSEIEIVTRTDVEQGY